MKNKIDNLLKFLIKNDDNYILYEEINNNHYIVFKDMIYSQTIKKIISLKFDFMILSTIDNQIVIVLKNL